MSNEQRTVNSNQLVQQYSQCLASAHPFHILGPSKYPFLTGIFLFCWLVPQTFCMHDIQLPLIGIAMMHVGLIGVGITAFFWFFAVLKESSRGYHTKKVQNGFRFGMVLFIASEVMLFFAFFWGFFHLSLIPSATLGNVWPTAGAQELDAWGLPLVNTLLLLTSGATITAAHAYIVQEDRVLFGRWLFATVLLGAIFLCCQAFEYKYGVRFSWRATAFGSIFFITTGFHGLHVTIGTALLAFCWVRNLIAQPEGLIKVPNWKKWSFTGNHHIGFEVAAWYWHFVDVVWLFLFLTIYWWGGK